MTAMETVTETSDAYKNFVNSLDSDASRSTYTRSFPYFMKFCKIDNYDEMLQIQPIKKLEGLIRDYLIHLREDKKVSPASIAVYSAAIAHFYEMNDITINIPFFKFIQICFQINYSSGMVIQKNLRFRMKNESNQKMRCIMHTGSYRKIFYHLSKFGNYFDNIYPRKLVIQESTTHVEIAGL